MLLHEFDSFERAWTAKKQQLVEVVGDGGLAKDILTKRDSVRVSEIHKLVASRQEKGIRIVTAISDEYPPLLRTISSPPPTLFVRGSIDALSGRTIAIVGTRSPTDYGRLKSRELARDLTRKGYTIISGLAFGVDEEAHMGALDAGGTTVAVLASSVDDITPLSNEPLAHDILMHGGAMVSEYTPKDKVTRANFVHRNRIIAALAKATIIIEGAKESGTRHQARFAAELDRRIFVLKPIDEASDNAELPLMLAKGGATFIDTADDIPNALKGQGGRSKTEQTTLL